MIQVRPSNPGQRGASQPVSGMGYALAAAVADGAADGCPMSTCFKRARVWLGWQPAEMP